MSDLRDLAENQRRMNPKKALENYKKAVAETRLKLAHTIRHLGDVYREQGHPQEAERCYEEALAIYRAHPEAPPLDLANAIRAMALLKNTSELWTEAKDLYEHCGIPAGVAACERRLRETTEV